MTRERLKYTEISELPAFKELNTFTQNILYRLIGLSDEDSHIQFCKIEVLDQTPELDELVTSRFLLPFDKGYIVVDNPKLWAYLQNVCGDLIIPKVKKPKNIIEDKDKLMTLQGFIDRWNAISVLHQADNKLPIKGLPKCNIITDIMKTAWAKIRKDYTDKEIVLGVTNYINDIESRIPSKISSYNEHRFSLYEFLKQSNGFILFVNK